MDVYDGKLSVTQKEGEGGMVRGENAKKMKK